MNETSRMPWRQCLLLFLFFALIVTMLLAPIASNIIIPDLPDFRNHLAAIIQAKAAFMEGQFPLRVAPLEQSGWRYPLYQFYSPTSYLFAGFVYRWLTPANPFIAYKITIWCALMMGGIYLYRLAFWFVQSRPAAMLASAIYLTAPYCLVVICHMGGFNEAISLGLLPVVLYYTLRRYDDPTDNIAFLLASFAWFLLATTHLVTFFYASLLIPLFLLVITYQLPANWKKLMGVGAAYVLGCFLGMWYLAAILLYSKYLAIYEGVLNVNPFVLSPPLANLLSPIATTNVMAVSGNMTLTSYVQATIGWPVLTAIAVCIYATLNRQLLEMKSTKAWFSALMFVLTVIFFLVWSPFDFWQWLPHAFTLIQYSWRLLGQLMWPGALLSAWAICWLFKNNLDVRHIVIGTLMILIASSVWFPITRDFIAFDDFIKKPLLASNPDAYLINSKKYPAIQAVNSARIDSIVPEGHLKLNVSYKISPVLLRTAVAPYVLLKGHVTHQINQQVLALVNGHAVKTLALKTGEFQWTVPLTSVNHLEKNTAPVILEFKTKNNDLHQSGITLDKMLIGGYLNAKETLVADQVKSHCHQQKEETICEMFVPNGIRLLELPVLYYPNMLQVTVNGKSSHYEAVLDENRIITGIIPKVSGMNTIKIRFRGILWANMLSQTAWGIWGLLLCYVGLNRWVERKKLRSH